MDCINSNNINYNNSNGNSNLNGSYQQQKMMKPSNPMNDSISLSRVSAEEMDEKRQQNIAYEYLCHLEEAKKLV
jgi:hypothetical protein